MLPRRHSSPWAPHWRRPQQCHGRRSGRGSLEAGDRVGGDVRARIRHDRVRTRARNMVVRTHISYTQQPQQQYSRAFGLAFIHLFGLLLRFISSLCSFISSFVLRMSEHASPCRTTDRPTDRPTDIVFCSFTGSTSSAGPSLRRRMRSRCCGRRRSSPSSTSTGSPATRSGATRSVLYYHVFVNFPQFLKHFLMFIFFNVHVLFCVPLSPINRAGAFSSASRGTPRCLRAAATAHWRT